VLHFGILGPLRVDDETSEIALTGKRRRSLLLRLLISANDIVSSYTLIEDLWEGSAPPGADQTLQTTLRDVRKALGHKVDIKPLAGGYRLSVEPGQIDEQDFEAESREGRKLLAAYEFAEADKLLRCALSRWRGPALADVKDTRWGGKRARYLDNLKLTTTLAHFDALMAQGINEEVIEKAEAAIADYPESEKLCAQLMLALYRSGQQGDALSAFERFRLGAHLVDRGLDPSPELAELANDILLRKPELDWHGPTSEVRDRLRPPVADRPPRDGESLIPAKLAALSDDFVGRETELVTIERLLKEAISEAQPRIVLITGEPGIGKSCLAAMAACSAHRHGIPVLYGHCDPFVDIPYQPWREVLDQLFAPGGILGDTESAEGLGALSTLGIGPHPGLPSESPTTADVYTLHQAVLSAVASAAGGNGLVLVIDDMHWADPHSVQLLGRLASGQVASPILVVATYRESEMPAGSPVSGLLASLGREKVVTRLKLSGLSDRDVLALLEIRVNGPIGEGATLGSTLMRETNGHPLFIVEILRHLSSQGVLDQDGLPDWSGAIMAMETIPAGLNELIRERVASLGSATMDTLVAASVLGREFDVVVVQEVLSSLQISSLLDQLDGAVGASLLVDYGGRFSFSHSLVARSLYDSLSPTRRAYMHGEVARILEREWGDQPERAAELAHHWLRASVPRDRERALRYSRTAGDEALARLAPEEARRWYGEALDLLEQESDNDERLRGELLAGLGDAERQLGDPQHRARLIQATRLALSIDNDELALRAVLSNTRGFFSEAGHVDVERVDLLWILAERTEGRRDALRARLLAQLAGELTFDDDEESRRTVAAEAMAIARDAGDADTLVAVLTSCVPATEDPDHLDEVLAWTAEAVQLVDSSDNVALAGFAAGWRWSVAWRAGDRVEVDRMWTRMEHCVSTLRQPILRWLVEFLSAYRSFVAGRLDESERLAGAALNIGIETGQPDAFNFYGAQILRIGRERDAGEDFLPILEHVVVENPDDRTARTMLARLYCDTGRTDKAREIVEAYVASSFQVKRDVFRVSTLCSIAHSIADLGWKEAAEQLLPSLFRYRAQWGWVGPTSDGPVAGAVARLAALVDQTDLAESNFLAALELADRFESPLYRAQTLLHWGNSLRDTGDSSRRAQYLEEAQHLAEKNGLNLVRRLTAEAQATPP
jgi:DNA-binding SARP family transcriptional activator